MLIAWVGLALAAPSVEIRDGEVHGAVDVARPPAEIVSLLADPTWVIGLDDSGTRIAGRQPDGACQRVDYESPSPLGRVRYSVRQCPTATGQRAQLVSSNTFSAYETEWTVTPQADGSRVAYRTRIVASGYPSALVLGQTRRAIERLLGRLPAALTAR